MAFAVAGESIKCEKGFLRMSMEGKKIVEESAYCFNEDKNMLYSKGFAMKKLKKIKIHESGSINPGFELCEALKGEAQFVEFKAEGEWYKLDRCLFADKSYIDTGLLYQKTR